MADSTISPAKSDEVEEEVIEMSLDKKLSDEKKLELITDLKNFPCLWETTNNAYKNRHDKTSACEFLSSKHNINISTLKSALHGLRTSLVREIKKEQSGAKSTWKFFEPLKFMKDDIVRMMKTKEEQEWSGEETEKLIDFYRDNEELWNHNLPDYRDKHLREINMTALCKLLPGRNSESIKKQWQILKTIFYRELKREEGSKTSGSGTDTVYTSSWKFFQLLMFIKGSDDIDPQISTVDEVEVKTPIKRQKRSRDAASKEVEEVKLQLFKEAIKCLQAPLPPPAPPIPPVTKHDDISLFVNGIESTLRQFTGRQLVIAKKKISDAMFEIEMEMHREEQPSYTSMSKPPSRPALADLNTHLQAHNFNWPYGSADDSGHSTFTV